MPRTLAANSSNLLSRPRRLRRSVGLRRLVRESHVSVDHLIMPYFVVEGDGIRQPIVSMPGQFRYSVDQLVAEVREISRLKIPGILLFGIPSKKDDVGSEADNSYGIIQRAVRAIKDAVPEMVVITDVCLCEYTSHGHCGVLGTMYVDNDATLERLASVAVSQADAGADIVAPSAMMDGQVGAIRRALDEKGFSHVAIMSYSAKYASAFYGPFREAAESAPALGDRRSYQMDPPNSREALREIALDIEEGADIVMVKPALPYLDVVSEARKKFDIPIAAYHVSGEYAMLKAAGEKGWVDEKHAVSETLTAIRRAGADIIITYFAKEIAQQTLS